MPTRRVLPAGQPGAGLIPSKPQSRRPRKPELPSSGAKKPMAALLIIGITGIAGYVLWEKRGEPVSSLHISPMKFRAINKSATTPGPLPLFGNPDTGGRDLLARAQLENELLYTDLQSFVCDEHIDRYKGRLNADTSRRVDTVTASVSFESGVERYSDIKQDNRARAGMASIPGAWSEGEFGTLLRQTHALLGTQAVTRKPDTELNGTPAAIYAIQVTEQDSPWDLVVNGTSYKIPFLTDVWVSIESGQILKIERTSGNIPTGLGISQLRWSVLLDKVDLDGKAWLLPKSGEYEVQYGESRRREFNVMTFSDYRRYGSRVVLHF